MPGSRDKPPALARRLRTALRQKFGLTRLRPGPAGRDRAAANEGSVLVYGATIKAAEQVHEALLAAGESAGLYHGKLAPAERHAAQEAFMNGDVRVMVATNAFGLGIDKPDIRMVLHYQLPAGLESYYQEAGRAGRDGGHSACTLLFLRGDKAVQQFFLAGRYRKQQNIKATGNYRASVDAPNRLCTKSTASSAVRLRTSRAGLISTTSREPSWPLSAIISMHSCISR